MARTVYTPHWGGAARHCNAVQEQLSLIHGPRSVRVVKVLTESRIHICAFGSCMRIKKLTITEGGGGGLPLEIRNRHSSIEPAASLA